MDGSSASIWRATSSISSSTLSLGLASLLWSTVPCTVSEECVLRVYPALGFGGQLVASVEFGSGLFVPCR